MLQPAIYSRLGFKPLFMISCFGKIVFIMGQIKIKRN